MDADTIKAFFGDQNCDARLQIAEQQVTLLVSVLRQIEAMPSASTDIKNLIRIFLKSIDK